jgi:ATP-binding protein involved in chromosome partitioning
MKDRIERDVSSAVMQLDGVDNVQVAFSSMTNDERQELSANLRAEKGAGNPEMDIAFAKPDSKTQVIAIASGKGGVGKSSVTVNLAAALAQQGHNVGVLDADIWGYSIPRMMGAEGKPVAFEGMVMPLQAHGCKIISIGFFTDPDRSVIWRGPMLHRALQQFLADVYWGELDFLLCDLPPGTGDIAISLAQMLPNADMLVVTTPQQAAQKVALRAGKATEQTGMKVAGVIENMASFTCPDCGSSHDLFGTGGGTELAEALDTELLGRIPIDTAAARGLRRRHAAGRLRPGRAGRAGHPQRRRAAHPAPALDGRPTPAAVGLLLTTHERLGRLGSAPGHGPGGGHLGGGLAAAGGGQGDARPGEPVDGAEVGAHAHQPVDTRAARRGQAGTDATVEVVEPPATHADEGGGDHRGGECRSGPQARGPGPSRAH